MMSPEWAAGPTGFEPAALFAQGTFRVFLRFSALSDFGLTRSHGYLRPRDIDCERLTCIVVLCGGLGTPACDGRSASVFASLVDHDGAFTEASSDCVGVRPICGEIGRDGWRLVNRRVGVCRHRGTTYLARDDAARAHAKVRDAPVSKRAHTPASAGRRSSITSRSGGNLSVRPLDNS
jgi:hypothetical protein